MTQHSFDTPKPVELFVEIAKGTVDITATDTTETQVEVTGRDAEQTIVREDGEQISVIGPKRGGLFGGESRLDVRITVPAGSNPVVRTGSADITVHGTVGNAKVRSGSGDVRLDVATGPLLVETGSGDIRIEAAHEALKIKSGSGDIVIGQIDAVTSISTGSGDVRMATAHGQTVVKTGSGDLEVGDATRDVSLTTGSGDLVVSRAHRGKVSAKGASGDVRIGIPAGVPVWTDITTVTGAIRSTLSGTGQPEAGADHVEVRARTVSGDIVLAEA
ncbi:hypothetical protein GCM10009795_022860 [Nocardioides hankookensis]|uniref:DUF4097 domain-containing protein n=1 Tax=Nocardioides hankookensis TaxID=443157 RepID=A0ABW1LFE5_9ACTN